MKKYCYLKKYPVYIFGKSTLFFIKPISVLISLIGIILLGSALHPLISYQVGFSPQFQVSQIVSPLGVDIYSLNQVLGEQQTVDELYSAKNWFPNAVLPTPEEEETLSYFLSIPKLKIFDAVVKIGVENLDKNLVQYPGTGKPGKNGNVVIFGHSVLPQFFNPKNYKTIFSTLPTIGKGEEILLDYDGIRYTYKVDELKEVPPNDVSILEQKYDDAYVTLVTCVPPGTYLRRLIVRGRLVK